MVIQDCDNWYANRVTKFHERTNINNQEFKLHRLNLAKRCCADDANLCEVISVSPEENSNSQEFINNLLNTNRFDTMYRKQLERTSADGTVGAYLYLKNADYYEQNGVITARNGQIRINYCEADCIIPLTVDNDLVTECAFCVTNLVKGKEKTTLVIFTMNESGNYTAQTVFFDDKENELKEEGSLITLGDVKPFSIMQNAEVNNLDDMEGYGLPKIYNAKPFFMAADLCFNILYGDLDKGDKIVFINELLSCIQQGEDGLPQLTPQQKKLFVLLGERLPEQDSIVKEYNPIIRIDDITKAFELILSLISLQFGYGTKKYTFENGQITTATEYIGTKQDEMQELNKQRKQAEDYINDIIHAAMWFSNQFQGTSYDVTEELVVEFDDSYIEDRVAMLENLRNDAQSFPEITWLLTNYLQERYNLSEEEVEDIMANATVAEEEDVEDETFGEDEELDIDALLSEV